MYKREDEKDLTMRDFQPWCMDLDRYMEENAPAREVPMTTLSVDGTEYMIPQGEEDVKATFSQLYIGYEDNMFSVMDGSRTMYENSPDSDGHDTGRFRMMAVISEDAYTLPDNRSPEKDTILAFYRKGIERPLSCGYAVTNGAMGHSTLDECHEYGEYFMLMTNMHPSAELQPLFHGWAIAGDMTMSICPTAWTCTTRKCRPVCPMTVVCNCRSTTVSGLT